MNLSLIGFGPRERPQWIIVDIGVTFGDLTTPGVELILPDITFIEERRKDLLGIVLTHAHEDHIGALPALWPRLKCPVYATRFTAALVRDKLSQAGLERAVPMTIVELGARFGIGPFDIEYVTLTHSIPEPNALAIRTPLGTLFHTGDWKIDSDPLIGQRTDEKRLLEIGREGVLAMLCDSTNVFTEGESGSESSVRESLVELIASLKGKVAVTTFASNVARLTSVIAAAESAGRHVALIGRSMHRITGAARESGYLSDTAKLISEEEAGYLPDDAVLYLCTGSQGEPRAALSRIAAGTHPHVSLGQGDTVIFSSRIIPGNETEIFGLQNQLAARGVRVLTEKDHFVHVSGHPCRGELARMYQWIRPEIAVPVHGELRHLQEHAALARELQVPQARVAPNGAMLRLAPGPAEIVDHVHAGRLYLDGEVLADSGDPAFAARRRLAGAGAIIVALAFDRRGRLSADPEIRLLGAPEGLAEPDADLIERLSDAIERSVNRLSPDDRLDDDSVDLAVRKAVRAHLKRHWSKRPHIEVILLEAG
ncbi:MAG: ribonuclease J [Alphaproteobacteria bacterium]|nr:ribonuclease J [Alphaproteobacteria bacterium]